MSLTPVQELAERTGRRWPAIETAREKTDALLAKLRDGVAEFDDPNYSIVVTGSLGRGEASAESDADWYLLVDGLSNPDHGPIRQKIADKIAGMGFRQPGRTGTFGALVTSHELVHYIAGRADSNENLTRRILLLSESRALTGEVVRRRVIGNVLARYVIYDQSVRRGAGQTLPLFLVNDVVRYWRTVASDYASKMWERSQEGWAIRNIKLRFSRKLLFVWGLIASFSAELFPDSVVDDVEEPHERLVRLAGVIAGQTNVTPLDLLARVTLQIDDAEVVRQIFSSYDAFLQVMNDAVSRKTLENLPFEAADTDPVYLGLREASREFRKGMNALFFDVHPKLRNLIREYGVF